MILSLESFLKRQRPGVVWEDLTVEERGINAEYIQGVYLYEKVQKQKLFQNGYIPISRIM